MALQYLLKAQSLTKNFDGIHGAFDINITIKPGEIVGFIGPNGAGKTTTLSMITCFINRDRGQINLLGQKMNNLEDWTALTLQVGFMPDDINFYPHMTPQDIFNFTNSLYSKDLTPRFLKLQKRLDLNLHQKFKTLSTGNRKKMGVINALLHQPKLVLMDEPTSGLDPLVKQEVLSLLTEIKENGGGVLLSSHVLSEIQQICDRVIMIKNGRIILEDNIEKIIAKAHKIVRLINPSPKLLKQILKLKNISKYRKIHQNVMIFLTDTAPLINLMVKEKYYNFFIERPNLEDMFLDEYKND